MPEDITATSMVEPTHVYNVQSLRSRKLLDVRSDGYGETGRKGAKKDRRQPNIRLRPNIQDGTGNCIQSKGSRKAKTKTKEFTVIIRYGSKSITEEVNRGDELYSEKQGAARNYKRRGSVDMDVTYTDQSLFLDGRGQFFSQIFFERAVESRTELLEDFTCNMLSM